MTPLREALDAPDVGAWVRAFLAQPGENRSLLERLDEAHSFHGPVQTPLTELSRITGPEPQMHWHRPAQEWEAHVADLATAIEAGHEPPPFIAFSDGSLADGNHRFEALLRLGRQSYWTIFCFFSADQRADFLRVSL